MFGSHVKYEKIAGGDNLEEGEGLFLARQRFSISRSRWVLLVTSHLSFAILAILIYRIGCEQGSFGSPVGGTVNGAKAFGVPSELNAYSKSIHFNGTLDFPSIYRGASPEVDKAWHELSMVGVLDLDLTDKDVIDLGMDLETVARFPEERGNGLVLTIEYAHQLHCVNLLRKVTHWNYPYYMARKEQDNAFQHSDDAFRTHVDHCLEMLRQVLMCHADTTPILENWVSVRHTPWPNFNTLHQCRDFDAIHRWTRAHERPNSEQEPPTRVDGDGTMVLPDAP